MDSVLIPDLDLVARRINTHSVLRETRITNRYQTWIADENQDIYLPLKTKVLKFLDYPHYAQL